MAAAQRLALWARLKVSLEKAPNPHTGFLYPGSWTLGSAICRRRGCVIFVNALEIKQKMNGNVILCMEPNHSVYAGLNVFPQSGQLVSKT